MFQKFFFFLYFHMTFNILQITICILPFDCFNVKFQLLPLVAGQVPLPHLRLVCSAYDKDWLRKYAQRNVQESIFVLVILKFFVLELQPFNISYYHIFSHSKSFRWNNMNGITVSGHL